MPDGAKAKPFLSGPVIASILVVVAGLGIWLTQRKETPPPAAPPSSSAARTTTVVSKTPPRTSPEAVAPIATPPSTIPAPLPRVDEEKIHAWLTGFDDTNETAAAILAGWKNLSEPGRTAAAPHLLNLVPDERFQELADILLDPATNAEVKDILFNGILNRENALKWPLIVRVMQQKSHPRSQDARNMLTVVIGKDYGDDWPKWEEQVKSRLLNENPP